MKFFSFFPGLSTSRFEKKYSPAQKKKKSTLKLKTEISLSSLIRWRQLAEVCKETPSAVTSGRVCLCLPSGSGKAWVDFVLHPNLSNIFQNIYGPIISSHGQMMLLVSIFLIMRLVWANISEHMSCFIILLIQCMTPLKSYWHWKFVKTNLEKSFCKYHLM